MNVDNMKLMMQICNKVLRNYLHLKNTEESKYALE